MGLREIQFDLTFLAQMMYYGMIDDFLGKFHNKIHLRNRSGYVAVVTGGTKGIGSAVVKMLLQCDMHVILGHLKDCLEECKQVEKSARDEGIRHGTLEYHELDLSSFESVKNFARVVSEKYPKINVLINNAAISLNNYVVIEKKVEKNMGVNYYSAFLLTHLLLPNLIASGHETKYKSRIIFTASCAHRSVELNFDDINGQKEPVNSNYSRSKLAMVLATKYLAKKFEDYNLPVAIYAVNPGVVLTDIHKDTPMQRYFPLITKIFYKNLYQGATPIVYAVIDEKLDNHSGVYISNCKIAAINPFAEYEDNQKKMYELSMKILNLKSFGNVIETTR